MQVTLLFSVEAFLKLIAKGFAGYFQSKTESLDLFVAALSLTDETVGHKIVLCFDIDQIDWNPVVIDPF